jgi:hypothetical protein
MTDTFLRDDQDQQHFLPRKRKSGQKKRGRKATPPEAIELPADTKAK